MIVDDATYKSVAIAVEHSIGGKHLTRILSDVARGKASLRSSDLTTVRDLWAAVLNWPFRMGVQLKLIEPGKLNQNAYVESFN